MDKHNQTNKTKKHIPLCQITEQLFKNKFTKSGLTYWMQLLDPKGQLQPLGDCWLDIHIGVDAGVDTWMFNFDRHKIRQWLIYLSALIV